MGEEVAEAPGGEGEGHDEVGVVGVGGAGGDGDAGVAGAGVIGVAETAELFAEFAAVGEIGGKVELLGFDGVEEVVDEVELGDGFDGDGEGGVLGLGMVLAAGEDDAGEAGGGGEFGVEDFEGGAAEAGGVGDEGDWSMGVRGKEGVDVGVDLLSELAVGHAEGEDAGIGEEPVAEAGVGGVVPGVWGHDGFDGGEESEGGGVAGLTEVEAVDGMVVEEADHLTGPG